MFGVHTRKVVSKLYVSSIVRKLLVFATEKRCVLIFSMKRT